MKSREDALRELDNHRNTAEHLLRNGQFINAAQEYEQAIVSLCETFDTVDCEWKRIGELSCDEMRKALGGNPLSLDDLVNPVNDMLISGYGQQICQDQSHFVGFECPGIQGWVACYQKRKRLWDNFDLFVPEEDSRPNVLILKVDKDDVVTALRITDLIRARVSYLLAHEGWSQVAGVIRLYYQHQIMSVCGAPAIQKFAQRLKWATDIQPRNSWAFARLGEVYRIIANAWPGHEDSLMVPESRVHDYVVALFYFDHAISLSRDAPGGFWVDAHLGAAILNIRAFASEKTERSSESLRALRAAWFRDSAPDELFYLMTRKAKELLAKAQRSVGNYYPWAEDYYSATLLFEAIETKQEDEALNLVVSALLFFSDAVTLQHSLVRGTFEPGELYVNPFFQVGLLVYSRLLSHAEQLVFKYQHSWGWIRDGMQYLFDFQFLPGIQALQGFEILSEISFTMVKEPDTAVYSDESVKWTSGKLVGRCSVAGVDIPETPITEGQSLACFILKVMLNIGRPTVAWVIPEEIRLNSNLEMSLVSALFVFNRFSEILADPQVDGDAASDAQELISKCKNDIRQKLGLRLNLLSYDALDAKRNLAEAMLTGQPNHDMLSRLTKL